MTQRMQVSEVGLGKLSIWELIETLRDGWKWIIICAALGLVGALVFLLSVSAKFEALAVVQPAKLAFSSSAVEPIGQTIERFKLENFYNKDHIKVCDVKSALELVKEVKVGQIKSANLFSISYRAKSPEIAEACINLLVLDLEKAQSAIYEPIITELQAQMILTKKQIDDLEQLVKSETKSIGSLQEPVAATFLVRASFEELRNLRTLYNEKRIQMLEPLTQPVKLLGEVVVSKGQVFPNNLLVFALGLILGFFTGLLALFINISLKKNRASPS